MSRSYDFINGKGPLDRYLYLENLRDDKPTADLLNDISGPFCDAVEAGYRPPKEILDLASIPDRHFIARFGDSPNQDWENLLTSDFEIGYSGAPYGPQDRTISITFATAKKLPIVSLFFDPFDVPDGTLKIKTKEGHAKAKHLRPLQAIAMDGGTLLGLFDVTPELQTVETQSFGANLMLPAHADSITLDGKPVDLSRNVDLPCLPGSIIIVREGTAAISARFFHADGLSGFHPIARLKNDAANGAILRFVTYQYQGTPAKLPDKHAYIGVLLNIESTADDVNALKLSQRAATQRISINTTDGLRASCDNLEVALTNGGSITRRIRGNDISAIRPSGACILNLRDLTKYLGD